jgi:hypothetical protein
MGNPRESGRLPDAATQSQEMEMKDVFNTLALALLRAARRRAELVVHMQNRARTAAGSNYRSNAGGWN